MHEPRHKEHIIQNTTTSAKTGLRPAFIVNGPAARDFVAFGDEILAPLTWADGPAATKSAQTGLRPVVRSEQVYTP